MKSKKYITLTTILWIALGQICPSAIHASVHFIEYVKGGIHPSMAINSQGHIHLSYYLSNLDYGRWDGISWSFEDVDMDSTSPRGKYSSICLDAQQEPHIVYPGRISGTSSYQLMHAAKIGSTWQLTEVDVVDNGIHQISADITTAGQIWASWAAFPYLDNPYHELRYSHFDGNSWTTGLIDNENYSGNNNSLSIDPITQYPKVTYSVTIGSSGDKLKYAEWNGTSWTKETIDSGCFISAPHNSMDIDSVGNVHVAYVDEDNNLKYASRINGAWDISTIDTGALWSTQVILKLDQGDNPHIVYRKFCEFGFGFSLIYANLGQSNTWKFARIIECPNPNSSTVRFDLALDPVSNVHIIFVDNAGPSGGGLYHMVILRTYYVDADAPAGGNGSSWAGAFNHLQDALAVAEAGDEIRVAQGVYTPEGPMPDIHQASNPNPADGATGVSRMADLSWTPGYDATSHDVYFGTTSPGMFQGNQTATTFDPCTMDYSTTYYWRIVELGNWGKTVGTVWSFTTGEMLPPPPPPPSPPPPMGGSNIEDPIESAADRTATFQLINGVTIKGGYAGFGEPNADARDIDTYETILSGDIAGDDGPDFTNNDENCYHVVTGSGCDETAVLDGFTITAGNANDDYPSAHSCGGGLYNYFGSPTLNNCTFSGNSASRDGGGMFNSEQSNPTLTNCTFTENSTIYDGGAMCNRASSPTITNCTFISNSANHGAGISNWPGSPILTACTFRDNSAELGGAVFNWESGPTLTSCFFGDNSAREWGGAICNLSNSSPTLVNCTFNGNRAGDRGNGMNNSINSYPMVTNCIFWDGGDEIYNTEGSTTVITYSDVQGGWPGEGNIMADPRFVQPQYFGPMAYWKFDETGGTTAFDSAGSSHGTVYGALWTGGLVDGALSFDGFNDYVDIGENPALDGLSAITLEAWIYPERDSHWHILDKGDGDKRIYAEGTTLTLDGRVRYTGSHAFSRSVSNTVILNAWQHVALTWSLTDHTTRLYHNGVEVNYSIRSVGTGFVLDDTSHFWTIGARGALGEVTFFDGLIDEAAIHDRVLSSEEIREHYLAGLSGQGYPGIIMPDYHLLEDSPCINTGDPDYPFDPNETDLDGKLRVIAGRIDMGAFEFNHKPVADAGPDQTVEAQAPWGATVTLDGSGSSDADCTPGTFDDINDFNWYLLDPCDPNADIFLGSGLIIDCNLSIGEHIIFLEVIDKAGASDTNEVTIIVQDTTPPVFTSTPQDLIVECDGSGNLNELNAWLASADAVDECGDVTITNDFAGLLNSCGATGSATVTWTAEDEYGNTDTTPPATFTIVDTTPPDINCPPDVTLECPADTSVEANGSATASDTCGTVTMTHSDQWQQGCGSTGILTRTWTATDECGNESSCIQMIKVVDTTPPDFTFSVTPTMLWPPNHKMVEITPSWTVSDECDASPDVSLVSIVANEGDNIIGDGHTTDDIQIDDDGSIFVRSERSGTNTGRIYTITYQAVDDCGNTTVRSATVSIPHEFKLLARMGERWLWRNHMGNLPEDLNGDGIVNLKDIAIFANNWIR
jgi:hypothetical protein